ncbi:MAG: type II toxin-antitoxin system prevent-host-death family antitoxin [Luteitalea sp.]|nr:type II toxin-antitoxin system prevent-host-death family antitoxin [Luteitalea sp.]
MTTVSIKEAEANLSELIHTLKPGDEVLIVENNQPVARLVLPITARLPRQLGTLKGSVTYIAPDFDEPPGDFKEYTR